MKRYAVCLTPDAQQDLKDIYAYIAQESGYPRREAQYMARLRKQCMALGKAPFCGQVRDDLLRGVRIAPLDGRCVVAFIIQEEQGVVLILNIFYGGRDYEALINP